MKSICMFSLPLLFLTSMSSASVALNCDDNQVTDYVATQAREVLSAIYKTEWSKSIILKEFGSDDYYRGYFDNLSAIKRNVGAESCQEMQDTSKYYCERLIEWSQTENSTNSLWPYYTEPEKNYLGYELQKADEARNIDDISRDFVQGVDRDFLTFHYEDANDDWKRAVTGELEPLLSDTARELKRNDDEMNKKIQASVISIRRKQAELLSSSKVTYSYIKTLARDGATGNLICEGTWSMSTNLGSSEVELRWTVYPTSDGPQIEVFLSQM